MTHDHDLMCPWAQDGGFDIRGECFLIEGSEPPISACELVAMVKADERSRIADAVYELMIAHPYEYPSDYAEADREWIKAGCPRDAIDALKEKQ